MPIYNNPAVVPRPRPWGPPRPRPPSPLPPLTPPPPPPPPPADERRVSPDDGELYTKCEFVSHFGSVEEWDASSLYFAPYVFDDDGQMLTPGASTSGDVGAPAPPPAPPPPPPPAPPPDTPPTRVAFEHCYGPAPGGPSSEPAYARGSDGPPTPPDLRHAWNEFNPDSWSMLCFALARSTYARTVVDHPRVMLPEAEYPNHLRVWESPSGSGWYHPPMCVCGRPTCPSPFQL